MKILLLVIALAGCYRTIAPKMVQEADLKCVDHEGVFDMSVYIPSLTLVRCRDRTIHKISED